MKAEISGYLKTLRVIMKSSLDVPAFLRRAQFTQRHIPSPVTPPDAPETTGAKSSVPIPHGIGSATLRLREG